MKTAAPEKPTGHRIDWVDYAKGFCIIFVVMMHSTLGVEKAADSQGWMHLAVQFAKPFRMPDFFLISGLFLGLVIDRSWLRYFDRKVVHFAYFYLLWTAIQFTIKSPGMLLEGKGIADIAWLYLQTFVEPFGTLWFIYMLPLFFVVTRLLKHLPWQLVLAAAALLEILPVHSGYLVIDEFASRYVYFFAGYLFANNIFALADWARVNVGKSALLLAGWLAINAAMTFAPVQGAISAGLAGVPQIDFVSDLPVISLLLGGMGAIAVIVLASLLSMVRPAAFLGYLGRHSIVVYLAFFLPMAATRVVLLKFAPFLDLGTVSLMVTIAGVAGPVVLLKLVQWSGRGKFLFERPGWAKLERPAQLPKAMQLHPAE